MNHSSSILILVQLLPLSKRQSMQLSFFTNITVKPVFSGHPKIVKTKILMTNGSLMKVESIAE